MIDAVYWAEMMYQGVHEEQENYEEFSKKPKEFRERKHDRVRSDLDRWEDPWLWVFRLTVIIVDIFAKKLFSTKILSPGTIQS